jgi:tetratricopeptide (TPR) repeat protein
MVPLFFILIPILGAISPEAVFEQANTAYGDGAYDKAASLYEQLISNGVHDPVVFYNLGNAYFNAGRLGPAVANFERALRLAPDFERARVNLDHALAQAERRLARPLPSWWEQTVLFWHSRLAPRSVYTLAIVSWCLLWVVLSVRRWKPFPYSRVLVTALAVTTLLLGLSAWAKAHPPALAVASVQRVPVRYARGEGETMRFELFEGDRVLVEERRGDWLRIATADGRQGWTRADALTKVGPPYVPAPAAKPASNESRTDGAG